MNPDEIDQHVHDLLSHRKSLRLENGNWSVRRLDGSMDQLPTGMGTGLKKLVGRTMGIFTVECREHDGAGFVIEVVPETRTRAMFDGLTPTAVEWMEHEGEVEIAKVPLGKPIYTGEGHVWYRHFGNIPTFGDLPKLFAEVKVRECLCYMVEHGEPSGELRRPLILGEAAIQMYDDPELRRLVPALRQRVAAA